MQAQPGATSPSGVATQPGTQRQDLYNQLEQLERSRLLIQTQFRQLPPGPAKALLGDQLADVERRIEIVDRNLSSLASSATQSNTAPAQENFPLRGPPGEFYLAGVIVTIAILFPLSVAYARRMWLGAMQGLAHQTREIIDRMERIERCVDQATLEIERIGEGQRFLTGVLSKKEPVQALESVESSQHQQR